MKKISKIVSLVMAGLLMLGMLCACAGGKASYAGTWYNASNINDNDTIILTSEGTFSYDGSGGDYSVEDGKMLLVSSWGSAVLTIGEADGETALTDEDGEIWLKGEANAKSYYEKKSKEMIEKAMSKCYGTFTIEADAERDFIKDRHLTLNSDGTYEYVIVADSEPQSSAVAKRDTSADAWQKGTWTLKIEGSLNSSINVVFTPVESSGYDKSNNTYKYWPDENVVPRYLEDMKIKKTDEKSAVLRSWPLQMDLCDWYKD